MTENRHSIYDCPRDPVPTPEPNGTICMGYGHPAITYFPIHMSGMKELARDGFVRARYFAVVTGMLGDYQPGTKTRNIW